ncbi:hypothetical protein TIFTF001_007775 [Ficus carica]|uniref:Uncharacterized protein n=1 Tax=Ficus carica TaxID=3494 RepID=A0AA87ZQT6_FICCA|nr:hypothetical protein TIFTF001_007775 [Ficus carica]
MEKRPPLAKGAAFYRHAIQGLREKFCPGDPPLQMVNHLDTRGWKAGDKARESHRLAGAGGSGSVWAWSEI